MNNIKAVFSQENNKAGFEIQEDTKDAIKNEQLIWWCTSNLKNWYELNEIQNIKTFNLKIPIRVDIYINSSIELTLMQKRVTKDTIIKKDDLPFSLKKSRYILRPFNNKKKQPKKKIYTVAKPINSEFVFNTIEYKNLKKYNYGSREILVDIRN